MKIKVKNILEKINYPYLGVLLVFIIGSLTLFFKPIVGMADNGDYFKIMKSNNLHYLDKEKTKEDYFNYFEKNYGINKFFNENKKVVISTQSIIIKAAIWIDEFFTKDKEFDLRFLAAILLFIQSIATYLILKGITIDFKNPIYKLIIVLAYIFIFMDTGYISYFNSFFSEGINISFFLLSVGIFINMVKFNKVNNINLILFLLSSLIFFGTKRQLSPIGILLIFLIIAIIKLNSKRKIAITGVLAVFILIGTSICFYKNIDENLDYVNRYHSLNRGILLYEENPEKILKELEIDKKYSLLKETNYFENLSQINLKDPKLKEEYYDKLTIGKIIKYYLSNPKKIIKMAKIGFKNAYYIRPSGLGNYEKNESFSKGEKSYFFASWSYFKEKYLPKSLNISIIYICLLFYPVIKKFFKDKENKDNNEILMDILYLYIFLVGLIQMIISLLCFGDADLGRHLFMYNLSFDLMIILTLQIVLKNREVKNLE